jgi:cobalt-zinc-cadmium efflux system protein
VPGHIDPVKVRAWLAAQQDVASVHDFHIWPLSTTETALTCHLVMPSGHPGDAFLHYLSKELSHDFKIHHATFQIETDPSLACALAPEEKV